MLTRPNVLLVGHNASAPLFGAELSFLDNLRSLTSLGVRATVILPSTENHLYIEKISKYTRDIHYLKISWGIGTDFQNEDLIDEITKIASESHANLLISNTITMREPLIAARRLGIPAICSVREVPMHGIGLAKILGREPEEIVNDVQLLSDYIIANSVFTLNRYFLNGKSAIVRNTFDERLLEISRRRHHRLRVGYVGSISVEKGLRDFMKLAALFRQNDSIEFLAFGNDENLPRLSEDGNSPADILFMGYEGDVVKIYEQLDVVLQLSTLQESFSRVTVEAMASGALIIAYNVGAVGELIRHENTGYLVSPGEMETVAGILTSVLEARSAARQIAENGKKFILENYSQDCQREDFRSVLGVLLPNIDRNIQSQRDLAIPISPENRSEHVDPFLVGNRARFGTATCVRFTSDGQLVVASLIGKKMHLVDFDFQARTSNSVFSIDTQNETSLVSADLFDRNKHGQIVTANCEDSSLSIYRHADNRIEFSKSVDVSTSTRNYIHGARFIPTDTNKIAACVTAGQKGIHFFSLRTGRRLGAFISEDWGVKDMSMLDSTTNKFVAIMTKNNVGQDHTTEQAIRILLVLGNRRLKKFKILDSYALPGKAIEGITIRNGLVFAACQSEDSVLVFSLRSDKIIQVDEMLGYSFPHGLDISPNGKLLAVANYGTASVVVRPIALSELHHLEIK